MAQLPSDPTHRSTVTDNGIRFVGAATRLFREVDSEPPSLVPGPADDALYGVQLTLRARGSERVTTRILSILRESISQTGLKVPVLEKGVPVTIPPDRLSGLTWRDSVDVGEWTGDLLWRTGHPTVRGVGVTHHIALEERTHFDRFTLRITADDGIGAVRGPVGAGQVRPAYLDALDRDFEVSAWGRPVGPHTLTGRDVQDFVRSTLLGQRKHPVAVLAPLETGGYALPPAEVAHELLGVAPLYVIDEHEATFRLTDVLRDKRLSCFFGALRIYMPRFTTADDPHDHPLLVLHRLLDPVMRAGEMGRAAIFVARRIEIAALPGTAVEEPEVAIDERPAAEEPGPARVEERPASEAPAGQGSAGQSPGGPDAPAASDGPATSDGPPAPSMESPTPSPAPPTLAPPAPGPPTPAPPSPSPDAADSVPTQTLLEIVDMLRRGAEAREQMLREVSHLAQEVERLRTLTNVRSAGTSMLERQISRLRDELEARLPPRAEPPLEAVGVSGADDDRDAFDEERSDDELLGIVRSAALIYPDEFLVLPEAEASAAESPYEDAERVAAVLDAMALVARRRMGGGLGIPLKEAFREFGVDYRGGISDSTSARHREQYHFQGADGEVYDCVEHVALGNSRDPRYCLRIYFTSRAKAENRFVIAHVGKHFDVKRTN